MVVLGSARLLAGATRRWATVAAVGVLALLAAGCGAAVGDAAGRSAPRDSSSLVVGGAVSPVPTSSPEVRCIRVVTDALRSVVVARATPRGAAEALAIVYGQDSAEVVAFHGQLAAFRDAAAEHGVDAAGTLVWPALSTACS